MLFTRCPGCQTTFRITADTLRVANGAVRCGSCATVFSAFSGLQQDTLKDNLQSDDEFLSPTLQMQELAKLAEFAGPELDETPAQAPESESEVADLELPAEPADDAPSTVEDPLDADDGNPDVPVVDTRAASEEDSAADDKADSRLEPEGDTATEALAPNEPPELVAEASPGESSDKLQFDAPADEWAQLLSEIEESTEEQAGTADETSDSDQEPSDDEAQPESEGYWNVGDPAATESWSEIEISGDEKIGHERVAVGELDTEEATNEPLGDEQTEADVAELLDAESDISAEEIDATLSADPDPELVEALEAALPSPVTDERRPYLWTASSAVLIVALAFQIVHHFRAPLAGQTVVGPLVRGAYGLFGLEVVPEWDLDQYEILNWVATEAGLGNLRITAQIRNNGPRTQPYPYIHLELKDRWEAVVGSRVFEPVEYLQPDAGLGNLMDAGATVPADFAVVDPGEDAYGFELDVCVQRDADELSCASQRVFE